MSAVPWLREWAFPFHKETKGEFGEEQRGPVPALLAGLSSPGR